MNTKIQARIDPDLKAEAERILDQLGMTTTDLIRMTLRQLVMRQGLPFEARIPNTETIAAIEELDDPEKREKLKRFTSVEDLMVDLNT